MTCETCGAPTGWVDGGRLTSANESKREAMLVQRQQHDRIATLEQQNAELVAALNSALEIVTTDRCDGDSAFASGVNAACGRHTIGIRNIIEGVNK